MRRRCGNGTNHSGVTSEAGQSHGAANCSRVDPHPQPLVAVVFGRRHETLVKSCLCVLVEQSLYVSVLIFMRMCACQKSFVLSLLCDREQAAPSVLAV